MIASETITFLREFNRWRRGDMTLDQPLPQKVGEAIDAACEQIEQLEVDLRKARDTVHRLRTQRGIARNFAAQMERERNESLYDATQETLKVSTLKSHWIAVCQERDQWRECAEVLAKQVQYWMDRESDWGPEDEGAMNIFNSLKEASK